MASVELALRKSHCHDILHSLRQALGTKSFLIRRQKGPHAERGFKHTTRAQAHIDRASKKVHLWEKAYKGSYGALLSLEPDPDDLIGLEVLKPNDLKMLSEWLQDQTFRNKGNQLSWLWRMTPIDLDGAKSTLNTNFMNKVLSWNEEGKVWTSPDCFKCN